MSDDEYDEEYSDINKEEEDSESEFIEYKSTSSEEEEEEEEDETLKNRLKRHNLNVNTHNKLLQAINFIRNKDNIRLKEILKEIIENIAVKDNDYNSNITSLVNNTLDVIDEFKLYDIIKKYINYVDNLSSKTLDSLKEHILYNNHDTVDKFIQLKSKIYTIMVDYLILNNIDFELYETKLKRLFNKFININYDEYDDDNQIIFTFVKKLINEIDNTYYNQIKDLITIDNYMTFISSSVQITTVKKPQESINLKAQSEKILENLIQMFEKVSNKNSDYYPELSKLNFKIDGNELLYRELPDHKTQYAKIINLVVNNKESSESFILNTLNNDKYKTFKELYEHFMKNKPTKKFNTKQVYLLKTVLKKCISTTNEYGFYFIHDMDTLSWEELVEKYEIEEEEEIKKEIKQEGKEKALLKLIYDNEILKQKKQTKYEIKYNKINVDNSSSYYKEYISQLYSNCIKIYKFTYSDKIKQYIKDISYGLQNDEIKLNDIVYIRYDLYEKLLYNLEKSKNNIDTYNKTIGKYNGDKKDFNKHVNDFIKNIKNIKIDDRHYKVINILQDEDVVIDDGKTQTTVTKYILRKKYKDVSDSPHTIRQINYKLVDNKINIENLTENDYEYVIPFDIINPIFNSIKKYNNLEDVVKNVKVGQIFAFNRILDQDNFIDAIVNDYIYYYQLLNDDTGDDTNKRIFYKYKNKYIEHFDIEDTNVITKYIRIKINDVNYLFTLKNELKPSNQDLDEFKIKCSINLNDDNLYEGDVCYSWIIDYQDQSYILTNDFNQYLYMHRDKLYNNIREFANSTHYRHYLERTIEKIKSITYFLGDSTDKISKLEFIRNNLEEHKVEDDIKIQKLLKYKVPEYYLTDKYINKLLNFIDFFDYPGKTEKFDLDLWNFSKDKNIEDIFVKINNNMVNNYEYTFNNIEIFKNKLSKNNYKKNCIFDDLMINDNSDYNLFSKYNTLNLEYINNTIYTFDEKEFIDALELINKVVLELKIKKFKRINDYKYKEFLFKIETNYYNLINEYVGNIILNKLGVKDIVIKYINNKFEFYRKIITIQGHYNNIKVFDINLEVFDNITDLYNECKKFKTNQLQNYIKTEKVDEIGVILSRMAENNAEIPEELRIQYNLRKVDKKKEKIIYNLEKIKVNKVYKNKISYDLIKKGVYYNISDNSIQIGNVYTNFIWFDITLFDKHELLKDWFISNLKYDISNKNPVEIIKTLSYFIKFEETEDNLVKKFQYQYNISIKHSYTKISMVDGIYRIIKYDENNNYPIPYTFKNGKPVFYKCQEEQLKYYNNTYILSSWFSSKMMYLTPEQYPYIIEDPADVLYADNSVSKYYVDLYFSDVEYYKLYKFRIGINKDRIKNYRYENIENKYKIFDNDRVKEIIMKNGLGVRIKSFEEEEDNILLFNGNDSFEIGKRVQDGVLTREVHGKFRKNKEDISVFDWIPEISIENEYTKNILKEWENLKLNAKQNIRIFKKNEDIKGENAIINQLKIERNKVYNKLKSFIVNISIEEFDVPTDFINEYVLNKEIEYCKEHKLIDYEEYEEYENKSYITLSNIKRNYILQKLKSLKYDILANNKKTDNKKLNEEFNLNKLRLYRELDEYETTKQLSKLISEYENTNKINIDNVNSFYTTGLIKIPEQLNEIMENPQILENYNIYNINPYKTYYRIENIKEESSYMSKNKETSIIKNVSYNYYFNKKTNTIDKYDLFEDMNVNCHIFIKLIEKNKDLLLFMKQKNYNPILKVDNLIKYKLYDYLNIIEEYALYLSKNINFEIKDKNCRKCKLKNCICERNKKYKEIIDKYSIEITMKNLLDYMGDSYQLNETYDSGYILKSEIKHEGKFDETVKLKVPIFGVKISQILKTPLIAESAVNDNVNNTTREVRRLAFILGINLSDIRPNKYGNIKLEDLIHYIEKGHNAIDNYQYKKYKKIYKTIGESCKKKKNYDDLYKLNFVSKTKIQNDILNNKFDLKYEDIIVVNISQIYTQINEIIKNYNTIDFIELKENQIII